MIKHTTKETFGSDVLETKGPVVLDFYADWCGPCKAQGKILEALDTKYQGRIQFVKCNVDENPSLAEAFGVETIPTLVFYKDGVKLNQFSSVMQEPAILRMLEL